LGDKLYLDFMNLSELQAYSNSKIYSVGPIVYMKLYSVNINDGSYGVEGEDKINQVAAIFKPTSSLKRHLR